MRWSGKAAVPPPGSLPQSGCARELTTRISRSRCVVRAGGMPIFEIPGMPGAQMGDDLDRRTIFAISASLAADPPGHVSEYPRHPLTRHPTSSWTTTSGYGIVRPSSRTASSFLDEIDKSRTRGRVGGEVCAKGCIATLPLIEGTPRSSTSTAR